MEPIINSPKALSAIARVRDKYMQNLLLEKA
jgi:hypothetical protein